MSLEELKKICERATPGPWKYDHGNWEVERPNRQPVCSLTQLAFDICDEDGCFMYNQQRCGDPADGEFIAAARDYMPLLIQIAECTEKITQFYDAVGNVPRGQMDFLEELLDKLKRAHLTE